MIVTKNMKYWLDKNRPFSEEERKDLIKSFTDRSREGLYNTDEDGCAVYIDGLSNELLHLPSVAKQDTFLDMVQTWDL